MSTNLHGSFTIQILQASKAYWEAHDPHTPDAAPGMDQTVGVIWNPGTTHPYNLGFLLQFQQTYDSFDSGSSALPTVRLVGATAQGRFTGGVATVDLTAAVAAILPTGTVDNVHTFPPSVGLGTYTFDVSFDENVLHVSINGRQVLNGYSRDLATYEPESPLFLDFPDSNPISFFRSNLVHLGIAAGGTWLLLSGYSTTQFWTNFVNSSEHA